LKSQKKTTTIGHSRLTRFTNERKKSDQAKLYRDQGTVR